jgi:hypothetical protein
MFEIMPESHGAVVGVRARGTLTDDEYKSVLIPALEKAFAGEGKLRVLLLFEDFEGWEMQAAWDDAVFGMTHRKDFERLALVGAPSWVEWGMRLFAPMMSGQVRSFPAGEAGEAWKWVEASA